MDDEVGGTTPGRRRVRGRRGATLPAALLVLSAMILVGGVITYLVLP
jgi:hypothetical protein